MDGPVRPRAGTDLRGGARMMSVSRSWTQVAGSLLVALAAGGSGLAQDVADLPALPPEPPAAAVVPPVAGEVRLQPPPGGVVVPPPALVGGPPPVRGGGPHEAQPPCNADRQTRRLWRRYRCQENFLGYPE